MNQKLVITTSTWYPNPCVRANCAIDLAKNSADHEIPLVVVDGGSFPEFLAELRGAGKHVFIFKEVPHEKGIMGPGRRQAIAAGFALTDGLLSCYCEAEKSDIPRFVKEICRPIFNDEADLSMPRRSRWSHAQYPSAQQLTEQAGNIHFRQATGFNWDMFFGPRWFNAMAGKYFLGYDDAYGGKWDPTHIPPLRCAVAGLRIVTPEIDYVHPWRQTAEEENSYVFTRKRFEQLANLAPGTEEEARALDLAPGQ